MNDLSAFPYDDQVASNEQAFSASDRYSVHWDGVSRSGRRTASGVYFYRLTTDYSTETRKMLLLK